MITQSVHSHYIHAVSDNTTHVASCICHTPVLHSPCLLAAPLDPPLLGPGSARAHPCQPPALPRLTSSLSRVTALKIVSRGTVCSLSSVVAEAEEKGEEAEEEGEERG